MLQLTERIFKAGAGNSLLIVHFFLFACCLIYHLRL